MTDLNASLRQQRSLFIGSTIREILYGVEITTFFAAVYCICQRSSIYRKRQRFYIVYGGVLLTLATISVTSDALWAKYTLIDGPHYADGQSESSGLSKDAWYNTFGFSADAGANILGDGLLLYRCHIIWSRRWHILAIPILVYLASSGLAIMTVVTGALPPSSLLGGQLQVGIPWISLSVSLNIIITSMICFRLLRTRAFLREMHSPEMSNMYTGIAAMLVESAAVFSILGIGFIVMAARNDPLVFAFSHLWTIFSSLSPQMIILRVSMGHGWLKETDNDMNTGLAPVKHAKVNGESRGVCMTISSTCDTEGPTCDPPTPPASTFSIPIKEHMIAGAEC